MNKKITKAIIPVAGLGTRMLPYTAVLGKEFAGVVDGGRFKPVIHYILEEIVKSGIKEIILVVREEGLDVEKYLRGEFPRNLPESKKSILAERDELLKEITIKTVRQHEPLGLGHAVLMAKKEFEEGEYFALILPDDIYLCSPPHTKKLIDAWVGLKEKCALISVMPVKRDAATKYGLVCTRMGGVVREVFNLIEKPSLEQVPEEPLVTNGRYILPWKIFGCLEKIKPGHGGEIQITDAIAALDKVYAYVFRGKRWDVGRPEGLFEFQLYIASKSIELAKKIIEVGRGLEERLKNEM